MEFLYQVVGGVVVSVLGALIIHYFVQNRNHKTKFSKIERAVFGEPENNYVGLVGKVLQLETDSKEHEESIENKIEEATKAFWDKMKSFETDLSSAKNKLTNFERLLSDYQKDLTHVPQPIRDEIEKQLNLVWDSMKKKVNKDLYKNEIDHILSKFVEIGERFKDQT